MTATTTRVIYILPGLGVGGVETAIGRSFHEISSLIDIEICTLDSKIQNIQNVPSMHLSIRRFFDICRLKRDRLIVTSLWRAHLFGFIFKMVGFKWVAFFHNPAKGHIINRAVCLFASRVSDSCFFDCKESERGFFDQAGRRSGYIVPFFFPNVGETDTPSRALERDFDMVFVGRLVPLKRLDLIAKLFTLCVKVKPSFKMAIAGAGEDEGFVQNLKLENPNNLEFFGLVDNKKARQLMRRSKTVICLSDYEGMAMSIVEGIQEGCVPVVRCVGEIWNYVSPTTGIICKDEFDLPAVADSVLEVCSSTEKLGAMNRACQEKLAGYASYSYAFVESVKDVAHRDLHQD